MLVIFVIPDVVLIATFAYLFKQLNKYKLCILESTMYLTAFPLCQQVYILILYILVLLLYAITTLSANIFRFLADLAKPGAALKTMSSFIH